jgi:hypothetical protein
MPRLCAYFTCLYVQRNSVNFLFLVVILPWYKAMFEWAWCGDSRCDSDTYMAVRNVIVLFGCAWATSLG